nr:immunoglobulin light chain junction region [Macaca mulatta]MPO07797.1 immunoglobulin light chain junction region [Macaca mulatta]MPO09458.1 immunoglobulin light chain junction region [Macaca mulatta]MPO09578.1 immunoglobulin light chain junction region [Macaca mulatta]MPO10313.1 immunoglobulin light chain junction region [Macaca mulatta]
CSLYMGSGIGLF